MLFDPTLREKPRKTRHPEAFCWVEYETQTGTGETIRIFNAVDEKVPLVLKVAKVAYKQKSFTYVQLEDYTPQAGDLVFRRLSDSELNQVAEIRAREVRRAAFAAGHSPRKVMNVATLRRKYRAEMRHKSVVTRIDDAQPVQE